MAALMVEHLKVLNSRAPKGPYGRAPPVLGSKANLSDCIRNNKSLAHSTIKLAFLLLLLLVLVLVDNMARSICARKQTTRVSEQAENQID